MRGERLDLLGMSCCVETGEIIRVDEIFPMNTLHEGVKYFTNKE